MKMSTQVKISVEAAGSLSSDVHFYFLLIILFFLETIVAVYFSDDGVSVCFCVVCRFFGFI